jgi:hypothetical protein
MNKDGIQFGVVTVKGREKKGQSIGCGRNNSPIWEANTITVGEFFLPHPV